MKKYDAGGQAIDDSFVLRLRFACWITRATDTLRICSTYSLFTLVALTRRSVSLYLHNLSCYLFPHLCFIFVTFAACGRLKLFGLSLRMVVASLCQLRIAAVNGKNGRRWGICFCPGYCGAAVAQSLRYCATDGKVAGSIPDGVFGIIH